ncbi:MAG: hypothetical protein H6708_11110 [Kofleriaceae bacterium]|nr:hypothetical protein [Kofleriaceae bacterium]
MLTIGLAVLAGIPACQVGAIGADLTGGDDAVAPDCEGPLGPPRDPAALPACCTDFVGGAHCLDDVPAELRDFLGACAGGGYCVPDPFIETGGVFEPLTCASIGDAEGRCLSGCVPQVQDYWGILPQDACADDERCVPCVSPIDGTDTGACKIAFSCEGGAGGGGGDPVQPACPHTGDPVIEPSTLPACAAGAHCLSNALIPADLAGRLADCPGADAKCVPDELIASGGDFIPSTCESVAGAEGRCLSTALPEVADQAALLPASTCAADHLCVPCFSPLDGSDTGACRTSCDPGPTEGPTQLPLCCDGRGTCVPASAAGGAADQLGEDTCPADAGLVCAPDVFLDGTYQPQSCETGLIQILFGADYAEGRCLPDCLPGVDNFLIGRDGCDPGMKCAPCLDPLTGDSSGACDPLPL